MPITVKNGKRPQKLIWGASTFGLGVLVFAVFLVSGAVNADAGEHRGAIAFSVAYTFMASLDIKGMIERHVLIRHLCTLLFLFGLYKLVSGLDLGDVKVADWVYGFHVLLWGLSHCLIYSKEVNDWFRVTNN